MKATPQISPNETNRTVLMVDGHGRIRTIHKFHQKLGIGIALVVLALLIAAGAIWMYADGLNTQGELRRQIDALRVQVTEAEHQKDLFLARAVKAEARVANSDPPGVATTQSEGAPSVARTKKPDKDPSLDAPAAAVASPAVAKPTAPPAPVPPPEPVISVTVDKFKAAYLESEKIIDRRFHHPQHRQYPGSRALRGGPFVQRKRDGTAADPATRAFAQRPPQGKPRASFCDYPLHARQTAAQGGRTGVSV